MGWANYRGMWSIELWVKSRPDFDSINKFLDATDLGILYGSADTTDSKWIGFDVLLATYVENSSIVLGTISVVVLFVNPGLLECGWCTEGDDDCHVVGRVSCRVLRPAVLLE